MPKVKINNTQGLVQESGGGIALYGGVESLVAAASAGTDIPASASLVIGTSGNDSHFLNLPATGSLDAGHTLMVVNGDDAQALCKAPTTTLCERSWRPT